MKIIVQRVKEASVQVEHKTVGKISKGLLLFVGFTQSDTYEKIDYLVKKVINLRIFDDNNGVMNWNVKDVCAQILSVSQFTLYGDTSKGNRPSYIKALNGQEAIKLYDYFNQKLKEQIEVQTGIFGADMEVSLVNDGPITILLER